MSYENLEEARAKRAEKEAAREAKGKAKLGATRKSVTPEPEEATTDKAKRGQKRKSATLEESRRSRQRPRWHGYLKAKRQSQRVPRRRR
jgi:hypothetical protein